MREIICRQELLRLLIFNLNQEQWNRLRGKRKLLAGLFIHTLIYPCLFCRPTGQPYKTDLRKYKSFIFSYWHILSAWKAVKTQIHKTGKICTWTLKLTLFKLNTNVGLPSTDSSKFCAVGVSLISLTQSHLWVQVQLIEASWSYEGCFAPTCELSWVFL